MNREKSRRIRILCLASVVVLMLSLCGCRTRLTNNDEVLSVVYDEDVFTQYDYEMKREELGLGKAKKPIFNGFGSEPEEEESFDESDATILEEYDPGLEDEPEYADTEPPKKAKPARGGSSNGGSRNEGGEEDPEPEPQMITVTLDPNGAPIEKETIDVVIGESYGELPEWTWEGHKFTGWYTTKGLKVDSNTIVKVTKDHSLFAGWQEESKSFTVTFVAGDGAEFVSGSPQLSVKEGGAYGEIPEVKWNDYEFLGWFSAAQGGNPIKPEAPVNSDQTWYAHWYRPGYWAKQLADTVAGLKPEDIRNCFVVSADEKLGKMAGDSGGALTTDETAADVIVVYSDDDENIAKMKEAHPNALIIGVSANAVSEDGDNQDRNLYSKLLILNALYDYDVSASREELKITDEEDPVKIIQGE